MSEMLSKKHLERHSALFQAIFESKSVPETRRIISRAKHQQLRSLILLLASVALKQVPATSAVGEVFYNSRKKRILRQYFSSWAKVDKLLKHKQEWKPVLSEVAPLLRHAASPFFKNG